MSADGPRYPIARHIRPDPTLPSLYSVRVFHLPRRNASTPTTAISVWQTATARNQYSSSAEALPHGFRELQEFVEMVLHDVLHDGEIHVVVPVHEDVPEPGHVP